jgi:hypothetical protein
MELCEGVDESPDNLQLVSVVTVTWVLFPSMEALTRGHLDNVHEYGLRVQGKVVRWWFRRLVR